MCACARVCTREHAYRYAPQGSLGATALQTKAVKWGHWLTCVRTQTSGRLTVMQAGFVLGCLTVLTHNCVMTTGLDTLLGFAYQLCSQPYTHACTHTCSHRYKNDAMIVELERDTLQKELDQFKADK